MRSIGQRDRQELESPWPRTKSPRRISAVQVPARETRANRFLIATQKADIEVPVRTSVETTHVGIDGEAFGDPPRSSAFFEQHRDFGRRERIPGPKPEVRHPRLR